MSRLDYNRSRNERYAKLRAEGKCPRCYMPVTDGKAMCADCREVVAATVRALRQRRWAAQLCEHCETPTHGIHILCDDCRADRRSYWPQYAAQRRERKASRARAA